MYPIRFFHQFLGFSVICQFAEMKRVERDHAKEKQKLAKDKDTGTTLCLCYWQSHTGLMRFILMHHSKKPVDESESGKGEVGESCS